MSNAGSKLRALREQLGLTMRDVENESERIARRQTNEDFFVPISRLSDFETKGVIPSIFRIYSLASVYRIQARDIFLLYGLNFDSAERQFAAPSFDCIQNLSLEEVHNHRKREQNTAPPLAGCYLLDLLLPRRHRESLIGDIEQDYRTSILPRYGRTAASIWFWKQVITEIVPGLYLRLVASFIKRLLGT